MNFEINFELFKKNSTLPTTSDVDYARIAAESIENFEDFCEFLNYFSNNIDRIITDRRRHDTDYFLALVSANINQQRIAGKEKFTSDFGVIAWAIFYSTCCE